MWTLEQKSSCSLCLILFSFIALCLFASLLCCCHNSDRCQSKKLHVAALNPNNSALELLTHYCYQSNISNCQLWEMFDCSWWQFASCLSWLLCINIPPSNPPRHIPPSAPVLPLLSGIPMSHCCRCWLCLLMCPGVIRQTRGGWETNTNLFEHWMLALFACLSPVGFMSVWTQQVCHVNKNQHR